MSPDLLMSFSTLVSDLEATGSATTRQLEELQHDLSVATTSLSAQEAEGVTMAARVTAGESQRKGNIFTPLICLLDWIIEIYLRSIFTALEARLEAEEAALNTLKTESTGIAYISIATAYMSLAT